MIDKVEELTAGFELLCIQAKVIAMLPLEEWWQQLERAETVGPFVDPTLMRKYFAADKTRILKELLEAAIPLKKVVLDAQQFLAELQ